MLTSSNIPQLCLYEVTTAVIISLQKSVMKKDMPLKSFYQAFLIQCEFLYKIYLLFLWMRQPENGTDSDGWREVKIAKEGVPWWFRRRAGQEVAVEYREKEREAAKTEADVISVKQPIREQQWGERGGGETEPRWVCFIYHCSISTKQKREKAQLSREKGNKKKPDNREEEERKVEPEGNNTWRGKTAITSHHATHVWSFMHQFLQRGSGLWAECGPEGVKMSCIIRWKVWTTELSEQGHVHTSSCLL